MENYKVLVRWKMLLSLAELGSTGTKKQLAKQLGVSEPTVGKDIRMLNQICELGIAKYLGVPLAYDEKKQSYVFSTH